MRHLLVDKGELDFDQKDRSLFDKRNLAFLGLKTATLNKSLKHI